MIHLQRVLRLARTSGNREPEPFPSSCGRGMILWTPLLACAGLNAPRSFRAAERRFGSPRLALSHEAHSCVRRFRPSIIPSMTLGPIPKRGLTILPVLVITFLVAGCVTPVGEKLANISVGMTRNEVVAKMGQPTSVTGSEGVEILVYSVTASRAMWTWDWAEYYVKLVKGKVVSYGRSSGTETKLNTTNSPAPAVK
jgi:hypothetical protein